jgi:hypothetical protein
LEIRKALIFNKECLFIEIGAGGIAERSTAETLRTGLIALKSEYPVVSVLSVSAVEFTGAQ